MATRSYIGKLNPETNTVNYIYCHYDGYLSHNGRILSEHYTDKDKVDQLLELGSISYLEEQIGEKHNFNSPTEGWTLSYSRDRNDPKKSKSEMTLEDYNTSPMVDHFYLFTEEGWKHSNGGGWRKIEISKAEA